MSSYIDYNYYSNNFSGTLIPEEEFDKYSNNASQEIRIRILNRNISGFEEIVKTCACKVAETLYNQQLLKNKYQNIIKGTDKIITSEKVGDWSRNISNISVSDLKTMVSHNTLAAEITELIDKELLFTNLVYRGI